MQHLKAILISAILTMAALHLSGCAQMGYELGSMLPPDITRIHVPTFVNATDEPRLETEITQAVIEALQLDGSLEIGSEQTADAVLNARIIEYRIVPIAFQADRASATEEYRVFMSASFAVTRTSDGEIIAQSPRVTGETTFELVGDLTTSKRIALPSVADDLAHDIVEKIVEYW